MSKTLVKLSKHAKIILEMKSKKGGITQTALLEYAVLNVDIPVLVNKKKR